MAGRPRRPVFGGYSVRRLVQMDVSECEALHRRILGHTRTNELRDRLTEGSPIVALRDERVVGYLSAPTRAIKDNFGVADSDEAMAALLSGASELDAAALSFIAPVRHANLFRWCLGQGFRATQPMTLMSIGEYYLRLRRNPPAPQIFAGFHTGWTRSRPCRREGVTARLGGNPGPSTRTRKSKI